MKYLLRDDIATCIAVQYVAVHGLHCFTSLAIFYFQVVGCTIDAGAKIYAGRVDAVHSDMLKMVGSITADAAAVSSSQGSHNGECYNQLTVVI